MPAATAATTSSSSTGPSYLESKRENNKGCHIWYSIEMSRNYGARENLLVVQVWAPANVPSIQPAVCIHEAFMTKDVDDDDAADGWEDMSEDEDEDDNNNHKNNNDGRGIREAIMAPTVVSDESRPEGVQRNKNGKRRKVGDGGDDNEDEEDDDDDDDDECGDEDDSNDDSDRKNDNRTTPMDVSASNGGIHSSRQRNNSAKKDESCDTYMVYLDPDLLNQFLEWSHLSPMNEATAFFLLMTFPFYEHEWDLVGFVLDQAFGDGDGDEEDGSYN